MASKNRSSWLFSNSFIKFNTNKKLNSNYYIPVCVFILIIFSIYENNTCIPLWRKALISIGCNTFFRDKVWKFAKRVLDPILYQKGLPLTLRTAFLLQFLIPTGSGKAVVRGVLEVLRLRSGSRCTIRQRCARNCPGFVLSAPCAADELPMWRYRG